MAEREAWTDALVRALRVGDKLLELSTSLRDHAAAAPITREALETYFQELRAADVVLALLTTERTEAQWQATAAEVRNAPANPLQMWAAAYTVGERTSAWIRARFPQGPTGTADRAMAYVDVESGDIRMAEWSVTQTAPLRALLDELITALTY